jgi:acetolactate synthase-1/2/3 large subunit
MPEQSGGEAVVAVLADLGVRHAFGIASVHNLPIVDAMLRSERIEWVPTRHEQGAVHAADGYARATGRVGVAVTSTGPGAANAMGGLYEAAYASSPVLMLTGQVESAFVGRSVGYLHEADRQAEMLRAVCRRVESVRRREEVPIAVATAARDALAGRRQPTAVEIPIDLQQARAADGPLDSAPADGLVPPAAALEAAANALRGARRPLIVAGSGVLAADGSVALRELAERLGALVLTSTEGRGAIAEDHPLALGPNTDLVTMDQFFADADVVLAVGTRFQQATPVQRALRIDGLLVHLDADAAVIGRVHRPRVSVVGDARAGLAGLLALLAGGEVGPVDADWAARGGAARRRVLDEARTAMGPDWATVLDGLSAVVPHDAVVVKDTTMFTTLFANRCLPVYEPRTSMRPASLAIGPGLPLAIGAAVGTGRPVVALHGDGGIMLTVGELATAVEQRLPLVVCVFNDGGYGILRYMQQVAFGGRFSGVDLVTPDFVGLARAVGMDATPVKTPDQFEGALREAVAAARPWLVEVDVSAMAPMTITPQRPSTR